MQEPQQRSWWGRNWKWVVPVGCLTPIVLFVGLIVIVVVFVFGALKNSWAYTEGIALARHNKAVVEKLGEPIEPSWIVVGTSSVTNDTGDAQLAVPLVGPKTVGTLTVIAHERAGQWKFEKADVEIAATKEHIDLLATEKKQ